VGLAVTVLGCDGSHPGPGGACSGYLVQGGGARLWVDAGSGTMANLLRHVKASRLDGIVLTHAHPDHWTDVLSMYILARYREQLEGLPVWSTRETRSLAEAFHPEISPPFDWAVVGDGDTVEAGRLRLTFSRTDHGVETLAVRIDDGRKTLVYSSDTGPGWHVGSLAEGADLALLEATWLRRHEGELPGHLSARQSGLMAREAGARQLVRRCGPPPAWPRPRAPTAAPSGPPPSTRGTRHE
jgi:ribonuclease BN (tRNA processing enzyme)